MQRHRPEEIRLFNRAVDAADELIRAWSKTLPFASRHLSEIMPEDWQHPYWAFLHVLKLREITGHDDDDPEVTAVQERFAREVRTERYREATLKADDAFRRHDYAAFASILEPFDDLLTPTQQQKKALQPCAKQVRNGDLLPHSRPNGPGKFAVVRRFGRSRLKVDVPTQLRYAALFRS